MKKLIYALILSQIFSQVSFLSAEETDKKKEIIETILQINNYSDHAEKMIKGMGSSLTKEEFMKKFLDRYFQKDFQDKLLKAFDEKFNPDELEEVYSFVTSDLYKKYSQQFNQLALGISPEIVNLALSILQVPPAVADAQKTQDDYILMADESNFQSILDQHDFVVVDIYASWCGPCRALAPVFQELSQELYGKYTFVKINADKSPALVQQLQARGLPTLLFYKKGQEVNRKVGFTNKEQIVYLIESCFTEEKQVQH